MTITYLSPLTFSFYNSTYKHPKKILIKSFFENVIMDRTESITVGSGLTVNSVMVGSGKFIGDSGQNFVARWDPTEVPMAEVRQQNPLQWKHANIKATYKSLRCVIVVFETGSISVRLGLKDNGGGNNGNNTSGSGSGSSSGSDSGVTKATQVGGRDVETNIVPSIVKAVLGLIGITPTNGLENIRRAVVPSNVSASGKAPSGFRHDIVMNDAFASKMEGFLALDDNHEAQARPDIFEKKAFFTVKKDQPIDVLKPLFRWAHVEGNELWNVQFTPEGRKRFEYVANKKARENIPLKAKLYPKTGEIRFLTPNDLWIHTYTDVDEILPKKIANVILWRTGSIQITGAKDMDTVFKLYQKLDTEFAAWATELFVPIASNVGGGPTKPRGRNRKPEAPQRRGRKEGTTCKPVTRVPVPNAFDGICPAPKPPKPGKAPEPELHVRPNAKGFPCCFLTKPNTAAFRKSIEKAYADAKVPIPASLLQRFPGLTQTQSNNSSAQNTSDESFHVDLDAKGRMRLDKKLCSAQPVGVLEQIAKKLGVPTNGRRGGRTHKKTKAMLCGDIQLFHIRQLVPDCHQMDEEKLRVFMEGFAGMDSFVDVNVNTNNRSWKDGACAKLEFMAREFPQRGAAGGGPGNAGNKNNGRGSAGAPRNNNGGSRGGGSAGAPRNNANNNGGGGSAGASGNNNQGRNLRNLLGPYTSSSAKSSSSAKLRNLLGSYTSSAKSSATKSSAKSSASAKLWNLLGSYTSSATKSSASKSSAKSSASAKLRNLLGSYTSSAKSSATKSSASKSSAKSSSSAKLRNLLGSYTSSAKSSAKSSASKSSVKNNGTTRKGSLLHNLPILSPSEFPNEFFKSKSFNKNAWEREIDQAALNASSKKDTSSKGPSSKGPSSKGPSLKKGPSSKNSAGEKKYTLDQKFNVLNRFFGFKK